jgi:hypothetical protein
VKNSSSEQSRRAFSVEDLKILIFFDRFILIMRLTREMKVEDFLNEVTVAHEIRDYA